MVFAFFLAVFLVSISVFVYGLMIKAADQYEPEPWWLLVVCFFWGALGATFISLILNTIGGGVIASAMGVRSAEDARLASGATASFLAPFVEESAKGSFLLVLWAASAFWLRELDGALDGAIYGGVIGLGFTLTEDVLYIMRATNEGGAVAFTALFVIRTGLGGLGHATFTAMTGLGVGIAAESRNMAVKVIAPVGGWVAAMGLHFLHNFLVSFFGCAGVISKFVVFITFDAAFFGLLLVLAFRDRAIVVRGLVDEVGVMLHPKEFARITTAWQILPLYGVFALRGSQGGYTAARRKKLALAELAFLKNRRRRGEQGTGLDQDERQLRATVQGLNNQGIFIGKYS